jgi:hypothetical protein
MEPKKMERNDSGVVPIPGHRDESPPRKIARTFPENSRIASGSYSLRKRLWRKIGFKIGTQQGANSPRFCKQCRLG